VSAIINSPAGIAGAYPAQAAAFGPGVDTNPVTADVVLVDDGTGTTSDGCELPFVNASSLPGKIALIDRGSCNFTVKVKNAQDAGAVGVLVANNVASGLSPMGGSDPTITIPSLGTSQALGTSIKANLPGVNASLALDLNSLAGTDSGCVRMYAPNPFEGGSSVSHFSKDAFPNLLMEPALNRTIFDKVDLTLPLFRDIGWKTGFQDIMFLGTFDPNPCTFVQP
ncbi:MAG: PA domain-containing protein, partial [Rhodanobacteraceae bacterium]